MLGSHRLTQFSTERPSVSQLEALGIEAHLDTLGIERCVPPKKYFHGQFPVCGSPWKVRKIVRFSSGKHLQKDRGREASLP